MRTLLLPDAGVHAGSLILVNAWHPFHAQLMHHDLVPVHANAGPVRMERRAARLLARLMEKLSGWRSITAVSGWRSETEQRAIYAQSLRDSGEEFTEKYVAFPGCSEHQTGLAIDLGLTQPDIDFIRPVFPDTGVCGQFRAAAADYGFIERYSGQKEAVTGIACEPWHFRYVGAPHAAVMAERNLCLEEYHDFIKSYSQSAPLIAETGARRTQLFYLPARVGGTPLTLGETAPYQISGNNTDGFVVTVWQEWG